MFGTRATLTAGRKVMAAAALIPLVALAGCAGGGGEVMQTDTGKGAVFGGVGGAALGAIIDHGDPWAGALIGAAGGALVGAAVGHHMDENKKNLEKALQPEINAGTASVTMLQGNSLQISMTKSSAFQQGSAVMNPAFISTLQKVSGVVKTYGKTTVAVIGHPDGGGTEQSREKLANQRAEAIRSEMIGMGVAPALISASGNPRSTYLDGRVEVILHPVRQAG